MLRKKNKELIIDAAVVQNLHVCLMDIALILTCILFSIDSANNNNNLHVKNISSSSRMKNLACISTINKLTVP